MTLGDIEVLSNKLNSFDVSLYVVLRSMRQLGIAKACLVEVPKVGLYFLKKARIEESER